MQNRTKRQNLALVLTSDIPGTWYHSFEIESVPLPKMPILIHELVCNTCPECRIGLRHRILHCFEIKGPAVSCCSWNQNCPFTSCATSDTPIRVRHISHVQNWPNRLNLALFWRFKFSWTRYHTICGSETDPLPEIVFFRIWMAKHSNHPLPIATNFKIGYQNDPTS